LEILIIHQSNQSFRQWYLFHVSKTERHIKRACTRRPKDVPQFLVSDLVHRIVLMTPQRYNNPANPPLLPPMKKQKIQMCGAEVFGGLLPAPGQKFVTCDGCGPRMIDGAKCMGTGVTLWDDNLNPEQSWSFKHFSHHSTAPMSEFLAIRDALEICLSIRPRAEKWLIWSDNRYAVDAFNGVDAVRLPHLLPIKTQWLELEERLLWSVSVDWFPSAHNQHADAASRRLTEFPEGT
jgi:ribonuclease HI